MLGLRYFPSKQFSRSIGLGKNLTRQARAPRQRPEMAEMRDVPRPARWQPPSHMSNVADRFQCPAFQLVQTFALFFSRMGVRTSLSPCQNLKLINVSVADRKRSPFTGHDFHACQDDGPGLKPHQVRTDGPIFAKWLPPRSCTGLGWHEAQPLLAPRTLDGALGRPLRRQLVPESSSAGRVPSRAPARQGSSR